jgi:hypothetical protein
VLLDLETFATGPREWDLIPTAVRFERFGLPKHAYGRFSSVYGFDVRCWAGYSVLKRIREVVVTTWLLGHATFEPAIAAELERRLYCLKNNSRSPRWTPY